MKTQMNIEYRTRNNERQNETVIPNPASGEESPPIISAYHKEISPFGRNDNFIIHYLFFLSICLLPSYLLHAQDTTLPQGKSRIQLHSGKTIKQIRLWRIDTLLVEYVKDGNLADVQTADVLKIETPDCLLTFDDEKKMQKRQYDLIVPVYGDTIQCFIQYVSDASITYTPAGSNSRSVIANTNVASYVQRKNVDDKISELKPVQEQSIVLPERSKTISDNTPPDSNGHYRNDDLIITVTGDSIRCIIDKVSSAIIFYHVDKRGVNPGGVIPLSQVKKYTNAKTEKTKPSAGEIVGKTFLGIGVAVPVFITMALLSSF